jgi:hypothetical protein
MKFETFTRVIVYTKKHLMRDPRYFFTYCISYFKKIYIPDIRYYAYKDIPKFLEEGKSIIRLGDGDIYTVMGGGQPYQENTPELQNKLLNIIMSYNKNSDYILCLNRRPLEKSNKELKKLNLINCWLPSKVYWELYFNKNVKYHDAAMFYYPDTIPKYFENYLISKKIIIISNFDNLIRLKNSRSLPFNDVVYLETPPHKCLQSN